MVEEILIDSNEKAKAVFRSSDDKQKTGRILRPKKYAFIGILIAAGRNQGKRLYLDEVWTSNKLFTQPFFYSSNVREQVQINLSIRKP